MFTAQEQTDRDGVADAEHITRPLWVLHILILCAEIAVLAGCLCWRQSEEHLDKIIGLSIDNRFLFRKNIFQELV